jgi:hypothetical protein
MYQVNLGDKILYYPASEDAVIYDTELNAEIGIAGEFRFKVPPQNPLYSQLAQGEIVTILRDGKEYWRGEIRDISTDFAKIANVYCIEDLAWLGNEYLVPVSITNETYAQRFQTAISNYNSTRSADRQFTVGYITNVTSTDPCNWTTEYEESILDSLRKCICNASSASGQIRVRRETAGGVVTRYIDIVKLSDYGVQAKQPIEYGYNLLNYVKESDYQNLVNVLTPYGDELDSEVYTEYRERLQGTTITEATSVATYGRHAKAIIFDNVTDLTTLNNLAASYLSRYSQPQLTMEVQAVDLAGIENVDSINIGDSVRVIATPFAVDQWLYLTQIRRDIQNIDKNTITLSGYVQTGRSLTSQTLGTSEAVKALPSKSSILEAAKKNALEILNGTDGGYVTFETNADEQITELRIANNLDINQATKCWKWNLGGLGYMSRDTASDPWAVVTAATMDGEIVADFITTGTMLADRIRGGELILGGLDDINGLCSVLNSSGVEKVKLNENGITATAGKIGGWTIGATELTYGGETRLRSDRIACGAYGGTVVGMKGYSEAGENDGYLEVAVNADTGYIHTHTSYIVRKSSGSSTYAVFDPGSDERLKKDIEPLSLEEALKIINNTEALSFRYKEDDTVKHYGFTAQRLEKECEELGLENPFVRYGEMRGDLKNVDYMQFISPIVKVIQSQQEEIENLKKMIKEGR